MRSAHMLAGFALLLAATQCGAPAFLRSATIDGKERWHRQVEERFAVRYCYRQYKSQTDVDYCLLRAAHLERRHG
jgi:hypothetical protein